MAEKDNKSKLTYHVWDKDNNEYDIPDEVVQQRGMDNFAKDFEGGYITMFDDKKQKVDVPIEDVGEYRKQGYIWYDTSGNATPINEVGKKPSSDKPQATSSPSSSNEDGGLISNILHIKKKNPQTGQWEDESFGNAMKDLGEEFKRAPSRMISAVTGFLGVDGTNQPQAVAPQQQLQDNNVQGQQTAQENNLQVQQPNQENASQARQQEQAPATLSVVNDNALMDAKFANYLEDWKKRPDKEGTYFENFVADLEAEGANPDDAIKATQNALNRYANRSALGVTNHVVSSLPDDTVQDAEKSIEAQWYSHDVQDKLKQEAQNMGINYDDYVAQYLKPAMVESLVQKYGPNYRSIAEGIATRLYSHDENVQDRLMNQDIDKALSDVISKYVNPSVVDEYMKAQEAGSKTFNEGMEGSQYIPANLRLGAALGAQYEANQAKDPQKTLDLLQKRFGSLYKNPQFQTDMANAAFKVMQGYGLNGGMMGDPKQFKPMIDAVLKNQLDHLEASQMIPKGSAEYIMNTGLGNTIVGKITRKLVQTDYQNWLQDIANQQYQPGFWERVGSGALTFAGDAWSYWLPGAAGGKLTKNMIAKAEGKLASDLMAKGMETKMAERAAKVLIGKSKAMALKTGAASGAVTFGGQSAISKPIDENYRTGQFDEDGKKYNPSVGKVIVNTLGEVAKQSAVGAITRGGTIANMIGKGRGLATNILADVGGKAVDSTIMAGQQTLEHMAQDPSFKPTGKDFAESALESMANLTSIGLPGLMGKYARFKDAREFNRKFDFNEQDLNDLKRLGYNGLHDAFEKMGIGEYAVTGDNAQRLDGQLTQKYMDMINDKSVPETLKAKMMAVVEGKRPSSFSPVVDSTIIQPMDNDGKVYLETLNKDGGVIERKEYSSREDAEKADKKLEYEKTLGLASVMEGEFHKEFTQEHLDGLYNQAAQKYNMGEKLTDEEKAAVYLHQNADTINDIMQKQQKGIILSADEQKQVDAYRHFYDSALENSSVMREFVNTFEDSHGVARGTLRKALESRDKKYAPLVESYLKELYNSIELKREMNDAKEQMKQPRLEGRYELPEGTAEQEADDNVTPTEPPTENGSSVPTPYQDRTNSVPSPSDANSAANLANSPSDAYTMGQTAYQNGDAEELQAISHNDDVAKARLKRAFADDEAQMNVVVKAYEEGKDMEQFVAQRAGYMTPAQQDAVRKYVEAQDAKKGALDALHHADDGYGDALKEQLWPYQTEDGNIVPATLVSGQQVFLKKANEYGGGFVVVPDEDGNPSVKQVSNADIKEVGTPIPLDDFINQKVTEQTNARQQQFISQFDGSGLKPNDTVEVAMEAGDEPMQMIFAGYSENGKIVLSDGKDNIELSKDEFNAWRQNALDASIGSELDAEDAQRANDDAAKAEADKQERYNEGIVGLGIGQPDYSSKDTEPKVAAEYLQEQFDNDHGKLISLINGSRSDIKEQLDNRRKAASEYEDWLSLNADLDPEKAQKVENDLALANEQIADLETRYKNWNAIRKEVMTPEEARTLKNERKAEIEKAGVDDSGISPSDEREVAVLDNNELKKQYPTMDEASNYIASERKRIYQIQNDEVQPQIDGINEALEQYMSGDIDYSADQLKELNTTKAQLEARQANLSASAKDLKAQANKLDSIYKVESSSKDMAGIGMTPSEQRKALVADAFKKNDLGAIKEIYKDASVDVMDLTPQTLEEAVSQALRPHSLNAESLQAELGKDNFKYGIGKGYDSNKYNYLIAKKGTGLSVKEFAVRVYNDLPINLQELGYSDQDVRNTLLDMFKTYDNVKEMRNVALLNRIAAAENELASEEEYYEAQKEREIIEKQAEIEEYKAYIRDKALSLPTESELNAIEGIEYDRMMEIEEREREYKEYIKSILPELADYDDRSNEEGYGGGGSLGSDSSRRGIVEGNRQGEEIGGREASSQSETGESTDSGRTGRQATGSLERGEGSAIRGAHLSQEASFGERLKNAIAETETEPTEAQKKAGNYKKGHLSFGGYDFTVETPKGTTRSGKDEQGKPWSVTMHDTYGYIKGKIGVDGDHIDMFINDGADLDSFDGNVYVVDQVNPETGEFDEHKVMYGYPSEEAATEAYLANYSKNWKGLGKVTAVPKATFDKWLESSDRKTKPFADYAMIQQEQAKKNDDLPFGAQMNLEDLPFNRDVKEVKPSEMTEAQKVAFDAVSTMLKKAGIQVKVISNEDMEKVAEEHDKLVKANSGNISFMRTYHGKGTVYGYTDGNEIVLNQDHLNPNTPIHEYQHIWRTAAKAKNPDLIAHGDNLIKQTEWFKNLQNDPNYKHLSEEKLCDEAFARLTGDEGEAILEQMAKDAIKENPLDTAKELSIINRLKKWLKQFWYWTLETFTKWKPEDIKKMTLQDIRNLVLRDLAQGVDPRKVLNEHEEGNVVFMGSTTKKRMKDIASKLEGRELTKEQQAVADVYSGKSNNEEFSFSNNGKKITLVMRQGNDNNAGTKHSVFRHYGVNKNNITVDEILSLPKMLESATRKPSDNNTYEYTYTDKEGVTYTVVTKPVGKKEHFQNFYSNKKANPSDASHVAEGNTYTPEGARKTNENAFMAAKVANSSETTKENDENLSDEDKIKSISQQFGVDEADVAMYANAIKKGSTAEAARARANIKRHLMQVNEGNIFSIRDIIKYTKPVNEALKESFGDLDAMIEERQKQVEAERNVMEAARKRAEEEEAKRQKHLEELAMLSSEGIDNQYMNAINDGDESTAREMLDEVARRKGYGDTESDYQGVGAWKAPSNPGYDSDKARRDDWESSGSDVNLEDMALGYTPQPDDYFTHPERYSQNTPHGLESTKSIKNAIDALKRGEKDVKVKVYRAVPTSVKEGKLRNGDWVTPSKKYAQIHGDNRLEGKYRIIEDEVPANQLWWDGNDANEFGFDDGKEYKYKNAKNNRKLNDLVTRDDKGNIIPPSQRFNSRKKDIRFMFAGEKGAAEADKADEQTIRMDNLQVAKVMEEHALKPTAIKYATGWERGADGKWRYEIPDFKAEKPLTVDKNIDEYHIGPYAPYKEPLCKLSDLIEDNGLFAAYPSLKNIDVQLVRGNNEELGMYDVLHNNIALNTNLVSIEKKYSQPSNAKEIEIANNQFMKMWNSFSGIDKEYADDAVDMFGGYTEEELKADDVFQRIEKDQPEIAKMVRLLNAIPLPKDVRFLGTQVSLDYQGKMVLAHEIQHAIQRIEGFAKGGTPEQMEKEFKAAKEEQKARNYAFELEEKAKEMGGVYNQTEVEKALAKDYEDLGMSNELPDKETRIKGFNYFARGYADRSMDDAIQRFRLNESTRSDFDSFKEYEKLAGEVESRNVMKRMWRTVEERRNSLASETEDVNRDEQIVMNGSDASYSIVKDPETIKKLDKEDTVKVYRAMQVGEDGKLYPPMAAKVKGKFVQPIELGKWEQADERPELADDKGMFTLNKGNGKSLKAAYNPYLHTSRTPLNDQFSEAQDRPNIVTVEVEVPKSELTSGYKADKAKDAVGEVEWKAGIIQGQLTGKRKVILSRWDKPVRIVPDSEVADVIVNDMFKGKNITMPTNVVTPSLRKELEKRGVPFVETDNRGRIVGGENDGVHYSKVYGKKANVKMNLGESASFVREQRKINNDFNDALDKQIAGTLPKGYTYQLGKPSLALKFAGIDDLPIELSSRTLEVKSSKDYKSNHPFDLASIKNLPIAIQRPVAIFDSEYEDGRKVILTELKDDKGHSIIAVLGLRKLRGRNYAEVNSIISLYGKDSAVRIANWFDSTNKNGLGLDKQLCRWADTKKASEWLTNNASYVHSVGLSPKRIAKIINSFVNNQFPEENLLIKHNFGNILGNNSGLSADEERKIADSVVNTANQLGGAEANVYTSLDDVPEEYRSEVEKGAKGWYDPETHTVHVYLPNCEDGNDAQRTVFHEKIGHEGMEVLFGGEQGVRKFADFVYKSVGKKTRGKILDFAKRYDEGWQDPDRMNVGTQEYIAHLAEEGPTTAEDFSLWTKIKHYLIKVLKKLGIRVPGLLNDKDLRYYLMKAGKALHVWDSMPKEKQEAMMAQASNAEIKDALSDGAGKGKPRQKKGESAIQYMKRVMEWKRWNDAREDTEDPEPPMFYDFDKDAEGKKEWERLNKEWRDSHGLRGEEMPLRPERKEGESDESFMNRYKEWEKWNDAIVDKENPMPDMFAFEKQKQDEARQKYEDWLTRHELNEQHQADLDLYEGKIYPAETNPKADALEQEVMQDMADVTSTDVSKAGAATTVKHAVIHRRKNMEEASAYDAIYINDIKTRIEKMVDSGIFDNLLADYEGKPTKAEKLAEAIPYIIEAPRRIREIAFKLNSTGVFGEGHIHITPNDVESIQELRPELAKVTANTHTELKDGKEVELFDDMKGATEVASKVANIINGNHEKEPGFVPIDGTDILNKKVLPIILKAITPYGVNYKELSEPMKATIRSIRDWYDYFFDWLKDNNTLKADTGFTVDYVNHLWDKEKSDKQAYAMYVENRQRTKSPNEKPREINTLMEGREAKLVPKTTDITKMMAYYSRSNIEAWANKTMLQEVSGLNVIERNEDGEIISSDPLLSSVAPFNLEQYKYFEIPGVGPVWVYNVSPKQVTVKNPITGKDKVLYSEASAGDRFGVVFDTYQSTPFWKTFDTLASSMKKLELGFSGFHAGALTEVYMVQNMVEYGPKKALANFMKYIFADTMKNHQLPCFANPDDFQEAATHLVKFGATNDYAAADVQNMFDNFRDAMMKIQEKLDNGSKIAKAGATVSLPFKVASQMLSLINKGMDRALWDFLHDGLKLATYSMRAEKTKSRAKAKGWTDEQLSKALDEDGQFVNDMFGGQHWDVLGASHRTLRYAGRVLLSPDWNASTTRHFLALAGYGSVWNEATMENFKNYYKNLWGAARGKGELSPEDWGRTSRQISALLCYGIGFMVFYEAFANGINAAFRAMDEEKERKKAEEIRKTNPDYKSPYELAYPDGMKWFDYLMRGNTLGQQSKIFVGRYADGTEMYVRHGKQFREVPEYLFNHKGELEFPGPMVQRLIGKANPMVRMTLDDINYLSDFQASHADQDLQRKYGKTIGLLYKNALYWAPFLIPSQENKEFKAVDFFFPSSKGFSNWKAQDYFKNFILSGDMEGVMMTYQSCQRNGIDAEKQLQAAISSIKALESMEMQDGVTSLQIATKRFDEAKSITEKRKMREKMRKFLAQSEYKAFTAQEAMDMVKAFQEGVDPKEMMKADDKYLNVATSADVTEDWRIQQVRASTKGYADKLSELKDTDKAKAGAFKNAHANVFKARKAISKATTKMNKLKKKLGEGNDKATLQQIRQIRKDLLKDLNGMEHLKEYKE